MKKKVACLIPVRSGSKRIKNKNLVKINRIPLIKFICKKIINSKKIDQFFIASDNIKIYQAIGKYKKKIDFFKRSKKSSTSNAKSEIVIEEFLKKNYDFDIIVFLQATNPFINSNYLDEAILKFEKENYDSLLSVTKSKSFLWKNKKFTKPINYNYKKRKMSQVIKGYFIENGSFYIFYKKNFLKFKNRLHKKIGTFEMSKNSMIEIDDFKDLEMARKLLK